MTIAKLVLGTRSQFSLVENLTCYKADPVSWKSGVKMVFDPALAYLAILMVSVAGSSADLERCFSKLGVNYGKLRNSMGVEMAGKLAFLYRQLNIQ